MAWVEVEQRIHREGWRRQVFLPWGRRMPQPNHTPPGYFASEIAAHLQQRCTGWSEVGLHLPADLDALKQYIARPVIRCGEWLPDLLGWYDARSANSQDQPHTNGPYDHRHHGAADAVVMPILLANKEPELHEGALGWLVIGNDLAANREMGTSFLGCGKDANTVATALLQRAVHWGLCPPEQIQLHLGTFDGDSMGLSLMIALMAHALGSTVPQDVCATGAYDGQKGQFGTVDNVPSKMLAARRWGYRRLLVINGQQQQTQDAGGRTWDEEGLTVIPLPSDPIAMIPVLLQALWPEQQQAAWNTMHTLQHLNAGAQDLTTFQGRLLATMLQDDFPAAISLARRMGTAASVIQEALKNHYHHPGPAHTDAQRAITQLLEQGIAEVDHWGNGPQRLDNALATAELLWPCRAWLVGSDKVSTTRNGLMLAFKALSHRGDTPHTTEGKLWLERANALQLTDWGLSPAEAWREYTDFWTLRAQVEHANSMDYAGQCATFAQHLSDYDQVLQAMRGAMGHQDADTIAADETRARLLGTLAQAQGFLRPTQPEAAEPCLANLRTCLQHLHASVPRTRAQTLGYLCTELWDQDDEAGLRAELIEHGFLEQSESIPANINIPWDALHLCRWTALSVAQNHPQAAARRHRLLAWAAEHRLPITTAQGHPWPLLWKWLWWLIDAGDHSWHNDLQEAAARSLQAWQDHLCTGVLALPLLCQTGHHAAAQNLLRKAQAAFPAFHTYCACPRFAPLAQAIERGATGLDYHALRGLSWNNA